MPNPGLSPAVQQALARRGMGQPTAALDQTSPGAAMANPAPPPAASQPSAPQMAAPAPAPKFTAANQDDAIVLALIEKMQNNDKLKKEQSKMGSAPQVGDPNAPMGGGSMNSFQSSDPFTMPKESKTTYMGLSDPFEMAPSMPTSQMQGGYPF